MSKHKNTIMRAGYVVAVIAVMIAVVTTQPLGLISVDDTGQTPQTNLNAHDGQADAALPILAYAAVAGATAVTGGVAGWKLNDALKSPREDLQEDLETEWQEAQNETLRKSTYVQATQSSGTTTGYFDEIDNSVTTTEGQLRDHVDTALIKQGDDIDSEAEAVQVATDAGRDYAQTSIDNQIEMHNFGVLSAKQIHEQLAEANSSEQMRRLVYVPVNTCADLEKKDNTDRYVDIQSDLTCDNTIYMGDNYEHGDGGFGEYIDGNGHTIEITGDNTLYSGYQTIVNDVHIDGHIHTSGQYIDVYNSDIQKLTTDYAYTYNSNIDNTTDIEYPQTNKNMDASDYGDTVTYNLTEISNLNGGYDSADEVPTTKSDMGDSNISGTVPAKNIELSSSYYGSDTVQVATAYDANGNVISDEHVVGVMTDDNPTTDFVMPINENRSKELIYERDDTLATAFPMVDTHSRNVWTNAIKPVSDDPDLTMDEALANESYDTDSLTIWSNQTGINASNPAQVISLYGGSYEGHQDPLKERATYVIDGEQTIDTAVLYSTSILNQTEQSADAQHIVENDTYNVSANDSVFVVNPDTGKRYTVDDTVSVQSTNTDDGTIDIRTLDLTSTDLSDIAERLDNRSDDTQNAANYSDGFLDDEFDGGFTVPDVFGSQQNTFIIIILGGLGFLVIGSRIFN